MASQLPLPLVRLLEARTSTDPLTPDEHALLCEWVTVKDLVKVDQQLDTADVDGDEVLSQLLGALASRQAKQAQKVAAINRQLSHLRVAQENPETTHHDMVLLSRDVDALTEERRQLQEKRRQTAQREWEKFSKVASTDGLDAQGAAVAKDDVVLSPLAPLSHDEALQLLADRDAQCAALTRRVEELAAERLQLRWDLRMLHSGLADELLVRTSRFPRGKCADMPVLGKLTYGELARYLAEHRYASASQSAAGWAAMGRSIGATGVVSGTKFSQRDCFVQAVRRDVTVSKVWSGLGSVMLPSEPGIAISDDVGARTQLQCFIEAVRYDPKNTTAWIAIGNLLPPKKRVTVFGIPVTPVTCYVEALRFDPGLAEAWMALGNVLGPDDAVLVGSGRRTKKHCFIKVLQFARTNAVAWYNLGQLLRTGETLVAGGAEVDKMKCFVEAVRIDPSIAMAWNNIAALMGPDQEPIVVRNTTVSQLDCILQALRAEPTLGSAWANLASLMGSEDDVDVNGTVRNRRQCIVEALQCDPTISEMWGDLGADLKPNEQLVVPGCGPVNAKECFRRSLELGSASSHTVRSLMASMLDTDVVEINRKKHTKAQLTTFCK